MAPDVPMDETRAIAIKKHSEKTRGLNKTMCPRCNRPIPTDRVNDEHRLICAAPIVSLKDLKDAPTIGDLKRRSPPLRRDPKTARTRAPVPLQRGKQSLPSRSGNRPSQRKPSDKRPKLQGETQNQSALPESELIGRLHAAAAEIEPFLKGIQIWNGSIVGLEVNQFDFYVILTGDSGNHNPQLRIKPGRLAIKTSHPSLKQVLLALASKVQLMREYFNLVRVQTSRAGQRRNRCLSDFEQLRVSTRLQLKALESVQPSVPPNP
jgi:hypothetical protein